LLDKHVAPSEQPDREKPCSQRMARKKRVGRDPLVKQGTASVAEFTRASLAAVDPVDPLAPPSACSPR